MLMEYRIAVVADGGPGSLRLLMTGPAAAAAPRHSLPRSDPLMQTDRSRLRGHFGNRVREWGELEASVKLLRHNARNLGSLFIVTPKGVSLDRVSRTFRRRSRSH